jgi:hypothetical protein
MYWGADCISYMRVLGLKSVAGGATQRQQLCAYDVVDIKGVLLLPHAVMRYCNGRVGEGCRGHLLSPGGASRGSWQPHPGLRVQQPMLLGV